MKDEQAERIAREVFALFDAHVSVPPELEAKLLRDVADKLQECRCECERCGLPVFDCDQHADGGCNAPSSDEMRAVTTK